MTNHLWFQLDKSLNHFREQIDQQGIIQFSHNAEKDYQFGYAIEDQARGLLVALKIHDQELTDLFLNLLIRSKDSHGLKMLWDQQGTFQSKVDDFGEASAETIWALGNYLKENTSKPGKKLYDHLCQGVQNSHFTKVLGYALLGTTELNDQKNTQQLADKLIAHYDQNHDAQWDWFEEQLTYGNALLPWGLLKSYQVLNQPRYLEVGLSTLDFLLENLVHQDKPVVVGNVGWWTKGQLMPLFDQQPIDVSYLMMTCLTAFDITGNTYYLKKASFYYSWFFGNNLLNVSMIRSDGTCHDGLNQREPNPNGGAESCVCFLLAGLTLKSYVPQLASNSYISQTI